MLFRSLDYERMWVTTSLRGLADGVLTVRVLEEVYSTGMIEIRRPRWP